MNTLALKISGAKNWHDKGYTGKGVTIAVIDNFEMDKVIMPYNHNLPVSHGLNVCKSARVTAPDANIMLLKWKGQGSDKQRCIDWINANKPHLINISLAGIHLQAKDFEKLEGHPLFCATGNNAKAEPDYPARFNFALAVGSWNHNLNKVASYSNRGEDIFGINPYIKNSQGNWWAPMGTSFATPFVSGLMACYVQLLKEQGVIPTTQQIYDFAKANTNEYGLFVLPDKIPEKEGEILELRKGKIQYAVVHHPAKLNEYTAAEVLRVHKARGFATYGYNKLIEPDGKVVIGRDPKYRGAHVYNEGAADPQYWNENALGYCLVWNGEEKPFPEIMYQVLAKELKNDGFKPEQVKLHREVGATLCPGKHFDRTKMINYLDKEWEARKVEDKKDYEGHWAQQYIEKAVNAGYMAGYPDGSFKPDNPITRAEFARVLSFIIDRLERR